MLLQTYLRAYQMKEAAGVSLFGPDLWSWPARIVDAFVVFHSESNKVEKTLLDSISQSRS